MSNGDISDLAAEVLKQLQCLQATDVKRYPLELQGGRGSTSMESVDVRLRVEHKNGRKLYVINVQDVQLLFEAHHRDLALELFYERCFRRGCPIPNSDDRMRWLQIVHPGVLYRSRDVVLSSSPIRIERAPPFATEHSDERAALDTALRIIEAACTDP